MGVSRTMPPGVWFQAATGIWVRVHLLHDPLLGQRLHRVDAHRDEAGHVWLRVHGANDGVDVQSVPPDTWDFMDRTGDPL